MNISDQMHKEITEVAIYEVNDNGVSEKDRTISLSNKTDLFCGFTI